VTSENVEEYIKEVIEAILGQSARLQAKAFREGFSKVFPITDLQAFALDELVMLFGNAEEDWSIDSERSTLLEAQPFNSCFSTERGNQSGPRIQRRKPNNPKFD
jgi:E3 ubiquitin-protein ligase TRIP12